MVKSRKNMKRSKAQRSRIQRSRSQRRRAQRGGAELSPAQVTSPTILLPAGVGALVQGAQYAQQHLGQHGGAAPVGTTGVLPGDLSGPAMQSGLLKALDEIKGMSDQAGGRRTRKAKKAKKSKKSKKVKKASKKAKRSKSQRRRRAQRGGEAPAFEDYMTGVAPNGTNPQFDDFNQY